MFINVVGKTFETLLNNNVQFNTTANNTLNYKNIVKLIHLKAIVFVFMARLLYWIATDFKGVPKKWPLGVHYSDIVR